MYNQTKEIPNGYNVIVAIDWADRKHDLRIRCGYEEKTLTLSIKTFLSILPFPSL